MQNIWGEELLAIATRKEQSGVSKTKISHMMGSMAGDEFREARQEINQFNLLQLSETRKLSDFRYLLVLYTVKPLAFSQELAEVVSSSLILKLIFLLIVMTFFNVLIDIQ